MKKYFQEKTIMKKCSPAAFCKTIRASGLPPRP
jgi:hypothetical protein